VVPRWFPSSISKGALVASKMITKTLVDSLAIADSEYFVWDTKVTGFGVRVRSSGGISYVLKYRAGTGRKAPTRRVTLATVGKITPEEARSMAKRIVGDVAHGDDPASARSRKRREMTILEVSSRYLSEHVRPHNKPSWAKEIELLLRVHILPEFGSKRIGDLTRADIKRWHSKMVLTPYGANRCLAVLRKMLSLAHKEWELRGDNPAVGIKLFPERRRERFFSQGELASIGKWLSDVQSSGVETAHFILTTRLLLLTGMRFGEVANLSWGEVDLSANVIRLTDAKAGARVVPLNSQAVTFLANTAQTGPFVCGPNGAGALTKGSYHAFWRRMVRGTGITNARPHDARHTVATMGAMAGGTAFILRDLLGHKTVAMTSGYVARTVDPLRELSEMIGSRIAASLSPVPAHGAAIVTIRKEKHSSGSQAKVAP
jgi:integrase